MIDDDPLPPPEHDPPPTDDRTLGIAATVLAALAILVVVLLLTVPTLRNAPIENAELTRLRDPAEPPAPDLSSLLESIHDRWRHGRFDAAFFDRLASDVDRAREHLPPSPELDLVADWAAGGQALAAGDVAAARQQLGEVMQSPAFASWVQLLPGRFVGYRNAAPATFHDWRLSVFWGDPLGLAEDQLAEHFADRSHRRNALFGAALVSHLDGDHATAAAQASELEEEFARSPQGAWLLARFVGDQYLWSGDFESAVAWYRRLDARHAPADVAAILHTLQSEGGEGFLTLACERGFSPACKTSSRPSRPTTSVPPEGDAEHEP